jgi:hypothetical protein
MWLRWDIITILLFSLELVYKKFNQIIYNLQNSTVIIAHKDDDFFILLNYSNVGQRHTSQNEYIFLEAYFCYL